MKDISKFQFKGYRVKKSFIELNEHSNFDDLEIGFNVSGCVNQKENIFLLDLSVKVSNSKNDLNIKIDVTGKYQFETVEKIEDISSFFYINSSAILFPYVRAYISTLTNLSGNKSVTLPTLNLTRLGEELKANTKFITE